MKNISTVHIGFYDQPSSRVLQLTSKASAVAILVNKALYFEVAKYKVAIYVLMEVRQGPSGRQIQFGR